MQHSTGTLQVAGQTLHTVNWLPDAGTPVKAIVLIVHGIGEHSGRYAHVAEQLTQHGYAVYSLDHRGHGQSTGKRMVFDSFEDPVNDLRVYFEQIEAQYGETPIFMYGHSMGSLIALLFALQYQHDLRGLISTGTPITVEETAPGWIVSLGDFLSNYLPNLPFSSLDANGLSHDQKVVADYKNDPNVTYERVKLGMAAKLVRNGRQVREKAHTLRVPLLLLHGGEDSVSPKSGSEYLFNNAGSPDKTLKIYPNLFHEIHNEPEYPSILNDMGLWLDGHV